MPIVEDLFDPGTGDPYRGGGYSPPPFNPGGGGQPGLGGGGGGGGGLGFFQGPSSFQGFGGSGFPKRRLTSMSPMGRQASPLFAGRGFTVPIGRVGGPTPPAQPSGGPAGRYGGLPGGWWDIPEFNRFAQLIATGDPSLAGTPFDPNGDPNELRGIRDFYSQEGLNRERQAVVGAEMDAPNDYWLRGYARTRARQGAQAEGSRAQLAARLAARQRMEQLRNQVLLGTIQSNLQHGLNTQNALNQQYADERNRPNFWEQAAPIIGAGLGAWAGGGRARPNTGVFG